MDLRDPDVLNALTPQGVDRCIWQLEAMMFSNRTTLNPGFLPAWPLLSQLYQKKFGQVNLNSANIVNLNSAMKTQLVNYAAFLNNWGSVLLEQFEETGSIEALEEIRVKAVEADRLASITIGHNTERPDLCVKARFNLITVLMSCFEKTIRLQDLDHALVLSATLVIHTSIPQGTTDRVSSLMKLGTCSLLRYRVIGRTEDLERGTRALGKAVAEAANDYPEFHELLCTLAAACDLSFTATGTIDFLYSSQTASEKAYEIHPRNVGSLVALATSHYRYFEFTGSIEDLHLSILLIEEAVALSNGKFEENLFLLAATALKRRFARLGSVEDLNRAIHLLEEYHRSRTDSHLAAAELLSQLAEALNLRAELATDSREDDLNRAVSLGERALTLSPLSQEPRLRCALARSLTDRSNFKGSEEDLNRAIDEYKQVISLAPMEFYSLPSMLNNVGTTFMLRYRISSSLEDLNQSIKYFEDALESSPANFVDYGGRLSNLARALRTRFSVTGQLEDLQRAFSIFQLIALSKTARPTVRVSSALEGADLLTSNPVYASTKSNAEVIGGMLNVAVRLLSVASSRSLPRQDQQRIISDLSGVHGGLASLAATFCLEFGEDPSEVLQTLELGRGIMASLLLETRTEVDDLLETHRDLAEKFISLRDQLDTDTSATDSRQGRSIKSTTYESDLRHSISAEFDRVIGEIRDLEGFETFGLGLRREQLMELAMPGPIVVLNANRNGAHAILVKRSEITVLPLRLLHYDDLNENIRAFRTALQNSLSRPRLFRTSQRQMQLVLQWLWDAAVNPILTELGFIRTPNVGQDWPHVWWVAGGYFSRLPIHAAGYHSDGSQESTIDRVISSYTPTIKALYYARKCAGQQLPNAAQSILLVSMAKTPGEQDLPWADAETRTLDDILPNSFKRELLAQPTKSEVVSKLRHSHVAHFACHGQSETRNPSDSGLLFNDWEQNGALTVGNIVSLKLTNIQLAYLSACESADNPVDDLLEESIHLSGACQLAGIPRIIATLWWIQDTDSASLATNVYNSMIHNETLEVARSAEALHWAVRELRENTRGDSGKVEETDPVIWASYIHSGA